ncbi:MAG: PEP-CTERM sorting domain-containing protein [Bryobacteraceae bacterium]|nr:PEP-CTERM sorting domain-containing protein [Bryobacteraceae bacterium]
MKTLSRNLLVLFSFATALYSAPVTVSTGDLGNNVIDGGTAYSLNLDAFGPSNVLPAEITIKYGLWNSPNVPVDVFFNSSLVGSFLADNAYLSTGPAFIAFSVTGLLVDGTNVIKFESTGPGDYVVGQVDLRYDGSASTVPEPGSIALLGSGVGVLVFLRKRAGKVRA